MKVLYSYLKAVRFCTDLLLLLVLENKQCKLCARRQRERERETTHVRGQYKHRHNTHSYASPWYSHRSETKHPGTDYNCSPELVAHVRSSSNNCPVPSADTHNTPPPPPHQWQPSDSSRVSSNQLHDGNTVSPDIYGRKIPSYVLAILLYFQNCIPASPLILYMLLQGRMWSPLELAVKGLHFLCRSNPA